MTQAVTILSACIESGYLSKAGVENWAINWISKLHSPPIWLMDLLEASSESQEVEVLREQFVKRGLFFDDDYAELLLGFYYLRFIDGDIQLNVFESFVVDVADAYEVKNIDPELINQLLNRPISVDKTKEVLETYFSQYRQRSEKGYHYLTSDNLLDKEPSFFSE